MGTLPFVVFVAGDYYYFCDAKRWLYMDTKDKVVYDSAKNFCNIRGASIPTDAEETCMTELATQVHKHIGQVHFWATRLADGNPLAFNGHGVLAPAIPTHKFNIACVDRRGKSIKYNIHILFEFLCAVLKPFMSPYETR